MIKVKSAAITLLASMAVLFAGDPARLTNLARQREMLQQQDNLRDLQTTRQVKEETLENCLPRYSSGHTCNDKETCNADDCLEKEWRCEDRPQGACVYRDTHSTGAYEPLGCAYNIADAKKYMGNFISKSYTGTWERFLINNCGTTVFRNNKFYEIECDYDAQNLICEYHTQYESLPTSASPVVKDASTT